MERHRIGIVIPALNESKTISSLVRDALQYGVPIVVDDGSRDGTGDMAATAGAVVVRHDASLGYDGAIDSGFVRAEQLGCEYAITMDADGQHEPATLPKFIGALDDGADVVIGIRDHRQRLAEHIFAWVASARWGIRDPLCGMKGYRIAVYRKLGHFDSYGSIGTELAVFAARDGRKIAQVPVRTNERRDSPRFGRRYSANMRIMKALWRGMFPRKNETGAESKRQNC